MNKVCVIGSINMDMVVDVEKLAGRGETVLGRTINYHAGGKGANQAVAIKRLGGKVILLGAIGDDKNGEIMYESLELEGIDLGKLKTIEGSTGLALINVEDSGENNIVVIQGANKGVDLDYIVENRYSIEKNDIILAQLEVPIEGIERAFGYGRDNRLVNILNPAPARELPDSIYSLTDVIIPNETETELLTGIKIEGEEDILRAGRFFLDKGVKKVIITLGERGSYFIAEDGYHHLKAEKVKVVDTTAAGDSFVGAFAASLKSLENRYILYSMRIANKAAAITVASKGAQSSLPYFRDIKYTRPIG